MVIIHTEYAKSGRISERIIWSLTIVIIMVCGAGYRAWAGRLMLLSVSPVKLQVPLSSFPSHIGDWVGSDLTIPATTKEYMERNFADDFFSRRYVNSAEKIWADVYVVYCSTRPGGILGHRPGVCYPTHGWLHISTETSQFASNNGRQIDCLVQKFRQPAPALDEVCVLSFYICNGRTTAKESDFSSIFGRKANTTRDQSRYVAQVQISSVLESSIRKAAGEITDIVLNYLPDENGKVKVSELDQSASDNFPSKK